MKVRCDSCQALAQTGDVWYCNDCHYAAVATAEEIDTSVLSDVFDQFLERVLEAATVGVYGLSQADVPTIERVKEYRDRFGMPELEVSV